MSIWKETLERRAEGHPLISGGQSQRNRGLEPEPWQFESHSSGKGQSSRRAAPDSVRTDGGVL